MLVVAPLDSLFTTESKNALTCGVKTPPVDAIEFTVPKPPFTGFTSFRANAGIMSVGAAPVAADGGKEILGALLVSGKAKIPPLLMLWLIKAEAIMCMGSDRITLQLEDLSADPRTV
jgi:hypothetical protein